jgi:flagellar biosynthetic protein FliR
VTLDLHLSLATLYAFLLVLARVSGLLVFLPLTVLGASPGSARIVLAIVLTAGLFPVWPAVGPQEVSFGQLLAWAISETGFGLTAGLAMIFLVEGFQMAAQSIGLQAGYNYASTVDPTSQADASVLEVITLLLANLLIFSLGLDHQIIRILAASFERFPAGAWAPSLHSMDGILRLGAGMLSTGLRLALPVIALLLLIDVALGLMGRIQQQLQLLSLAFPAKMLAALALLTVVAPAMPRLFQASSKHVFATLWRLLDR